MVCPILVTEPQLQKIKIETQPTAIFQNNLNLAEPFANKAWKQQNTREIL
jgi:hypothetical protein